MPSAPGAARRCRTRCQRILSLEDVWEADPCWECGKSRARAENDDAALFLWYFWPSQKWEVSEISRGATRPCEISSSFANPLRPGFISDLVFSLFLLFIPIKHPFALKGCSVLSSTSVQIRGRGRSNNVPSHPATSCTKNGGGKGTRSPSITAGKRKYIYLSQCDRINPPPQPCSSSDPAFIGQGKCGMPQKLPH